MKSCHWSAGNKGSIDWGIGCLAGMYWRVRKNLAKTYNVADNGTKGILSGGTEIIVEGIQMILDMADVTGFSGTEQT